MVGPGARCVLRGLFRHFSRHVVHAVVCWALFPPVLHGSPVWHGSLLAGRPIMTDVAQRLQAVAGRKRTVPVRWRGPRRPRDCPPACHNRPDNLPPFAVRALSAIVTA